MARFIKIYTTFLININVIFKKYWRKLLFNEKLILGIQLHISANCISEMILVLKYRLDRNRSIFMR